MTNAVFETSTGVSARTRAAAGVLVVLAGFLTPSAALAAYTGGATGGFTVTPTSREESRQFYNVIHQLSEDTPLNWTGSIAACDAGTTSDNYKKAVIVRVNYFRAMTGAPGVTLNPAWNTTVQKAALIVAANSHIPEEPKHEPPASYACYTVEGATGSGASDLSKQAIGPQAVNVFMSDHEGNDWAVGHRRWVIFPQTQEMATGDVPPAAGSSKKGSALWVMDGRSGNPRPATREAYCAWPPPGYVPYQVVFPRWSFGLGGADLTAMTVTMKQGATTLPVTLEPYTGGIGENTRAWSSAGLDPGTSAPPAVDTPYTVTVSGVKIGGVTQSPYVYTVTVFNPAATGPDTVVTSLSGPAALNAGQPGTYTHPLVNFAPNYELVDAAVTPSFSEIEGAENGVANMSTYLQAGANVISTTVKASGAKSFHLTNQDWFSPALTWQRTVLPTAVSRLQFKCRMGYTAPGQTALVHVSKNGGISWTEIYSDTRNVSADPDFVLKDLSLAAFAGYPVQIRFSLRAVMDGQPVYTQTDDTMGWFLDDITVTGASLLTNPAVVATTAGNSFTYTPAAVGQRALYTRPLVFQGYPMDSGPALLVTVSGGGGAAALNVSAWSVGGAQMQLDFRGTGLPGSPVLKLQRSNTLSPPWTDVTGATLQNQGSGNYRFTAPVPAGPRGFFRVTLN